MSVQDHDAVFKSSARPSEALSVKEAILAIGTLVMFSDGEIKVEELEAISEAVVDEDFSAEALQQASHKVSRLYHDDGPGALFNAAMQVLPAHQMESVFELAVETALSDHEFSAEEKDYVAALAQSMDIPDATVQRILEKFAAG